MSSTSPAVIGAVLYIIAMAFFLGAFGLRKIKITRVVNPPWYKTAWARVSATAIVAVAGVSIITWQSGAIQEFQKRQAEFHQHATTGGATRGRSAGNPSLTHGRGQPIQASVMPGMTAPTFAGTTTAAFSQAQTSAAKPIELSMDRLEALLKQDPTPVTFVVFVNGTNRLNVTLSVDSHLQFAAGADNTTVQATVTYPDAVRHEVVELIRQSKVPYSAIDAAAQPTAPPVVQVLAPPADGSFSTKDYIFFGFMALMVGVLVFQMMGQRKALKGTAKSQQGLTNSPAKKVLPERITDASFKKVAGCDEAIHSLQEIAEWLADPSAFVKHGAKVPHGALLEGPPGTGKTLLARTLAAESKALFYAVAGSDFVEMFVGRGAGRVRSMFADIRADMKREKKSAILFIDEIDSVGRKRNGGLGGNDERDQTLNQLLVEMDGFQPEEGLLVIAATNMPDILDEALTRPGRFGDCRIKVDLPNVTGRIAIFKIHLADKPSGNLIDPEVPASLTPGFSGASIAAACNRAAILATRRYKKLSLMDKLKGLAHLRSAEPITIDDLAEGIKFVQMGDVRTGLAKAMTLSEKKNTAYHEGGHAIVTKELGQSKVGQITILPRMNTLGLVQTADEGKVSHSQEWLEARIAVMMAGRVAQEIFLDTVDTGAQNDFFQATVLAKRMLCQWGMSEKIGHISVHIDEHGNLPAYLAPELANSIEAQTKTIVETHYKRAYDILTARKAEMERLVAVLLVKETIMGKEFDDVWEGRVDPAVLAAAENLSREADTAIGASVQAVSN